MLRAIERAFPRHFTERRVVVHVGEAIWDLRNRASEWAQHHGLKLVFSDDDAWSLVQRP